jgi:hypothetical protein
MILVRKPFDIGDRIAVSDVIKETNPEGSQGWIVERVNLYTTTMRFARTREVCTVTNGELSRTRIINLNRSQKAIVYVYLKFSVDIASSKIEVLQSQVDAFVKDRPREWMSLNGFRATRIEADLGYVEYVIVLQHREAWQNVTSIVTSKAELQSFCLELSKDLGLRYVAPPLPVDLVFNGVSSRSADEEDKDDQGKQQMEEAAASLRQLFEVKKVK